MPWLCITAAFFVICAGKNNVFHFPSSSRIWSSVYSLPWFNIRYFASPLIANEWLHPQAASPFSNIMDSTPQQYSQLIWEVIFMYLSLSAPLTDNFLSKSPILVIVASAFFWSEAETSS